MTANQNGQLVSSEMVNSSFEPHKQVAAVSQNPTTISSMCAVFAKSEDVSLRNSGSAPEDIARAIHQSIADRISKYA